MSRTRRDGHQPARAATRAGAATGAGAARAATRAPLLAALLGGTLLGLTLLAGCGDGGRSAARSVAPSAANGGSAVAAPSLDGHPSTHAAAGAVAGPAPEAGAGKAAPGGALARIAPQVDQLIRRADVEVQVPDVTAAERRTRTLVDDADGVVYSEHLNRDPANRVRTDLTIKLPPKGFDQLLGALGTLGRTVSVNSSTEDVSDQVVDVDARVRSQQDSVTRVRALLSRATSLSEVVQVESELTRRLSDLESLEARQKELAAQVALSTVTVTLTGPPPAGPRRHHQASGTGFGAGLRAGWHAFARSVNAALTVVGALLPFLVVLALLWLPGRWLLRRTRHWLPAPATGPAPGSD